MHRSRRATPYVVISLMWETVQALGINEKYSKDINKALSQAYDEAHAEITYIVPESANPEIVMLGEPNRGTLPKMVRQEGEYINTPKKKTGKQNRN